MFSLYTVQWALTFPNLRRHCLRYLHSRSYLYSFYEHWCYRITAEILRQPTASGLSLNVLRVRLHFTGFSTAEYQLAR